MDEARHLYDQIAKRTAGSIYIGVVGPVPFRNCLHTSIATEKLICFSCGTGIFRAISEA